MRCLYCVGRLCCWVLWSWLTLFVNCSLPWFFLLNVSTVRQYLVFSVFYLPGERMGKFSREVWPRVFGCRFQGASIVTVEPFPIWETPTNIGHRIQGPSCYFFEHRTYCDLRVAYEVWVAVAGGFFWSLITFVCWVLSSLISFRWKTSFIAITVNSVLHHRWEKNEIKFSRYLNSVFGSRVQGADN